MSSTIAMPKKLIINTVFIAFLLIFLCNFLNCQSAEIKNQLKKLNDPKVQSALGFMFMLLQTMGTVVLAYQKDKREEKENKRRKKEERKRKERREKKREEEKAKKAKAILKYIDAIDNNDIKYIKDNLYRYQNQLMIPLG